MTRDYELSTRAVWLIFASEMKFNEIIINDESIEAIMAKAKAFEFKEDAYYGRVKGLLTHSLFWKLK